ncbi:MAG: DUF1345 domain-containing protein [Actinomycetota bacterium]
MSTTRQDDKPVRLGVSALTRVLVAAAVGVVAGGIAATLTPWPIALLLGWDASAAVFVAWIWLRIWHLNASATARIATREDDSRSAADLVLLVASIASIGGVGLALLQSSEETGVAQALSTGVAVMSVIFSWFAIHTVFTLHYARFYYRDNAGITFHDDDPPDYRDFAYVAFTVGMTYQVADTDLTSRSLRRVTLRHALLSFLFGTAVLAVMINLVAGLLGR